MMEDINNGVRSTVGAVIERLSSRRGKTNLEKMRGVAEHFDKEDSQVLLVKRNHKPFNGYWTIPGGHIDFGETAEQAVIREVKEETGLTFMPKFLGYRDEIYPDINWHGEVLVFHGEAQGKEKIDGKEIIGIKWVNIDEASNMKLAFEHEKTLKIYKNKRG